MTKQFKKELNKEKSVRRLCLRVLFFSYLLS
nr:MAG TPA: hypothetical protein [Caudoviricetes sp.]